MATIKPISDNDKKLLRKAFKKCYYLLHDLMEHQHGWVFNSPVDVKGTGLKDYYKVVKHPMDLGTVKSRLEMGRYLSPVQFARDTKLVFNNAMSYNFEGEPAYDMAEELLQIFLKKWCSIKSEFAPLLSHDDMAFKKCGKLLKQLMKHQYGSIFHTLVDSDLREYCDIVRRPIDLNMIKTKLKNENYSSPLEFEEDVKLTFYNAMLYFNEGVYEYMGAKELQDFFNKKWASIKAEFEPLLDDDYMVNSFDPERIYQKK